MCVADTTRAQLPTSQGTLVISTVQRVLQLAHLQGRAQANGVYGVGVPGHEGNALIVIAMGAQQRQNLIVCICQDDISLQASAVTSVLQGHNS